MGWTRAQVVNVAKRTGYPVVEAWSSNNQGAMGTVYGPMLHHTATSAAAAGDYPTLRIVRDGRADLKNSLCMYGLGRSGTIYCISEKISWHAGAGNWNGVTDGNGHFAGIEAESDGRAWTAAQLDAYAKLCASILKETGRDTNWMPRHADYALPKGRKTDTSGLDYNALKNKVAGLLAAPTIAAVSYPVYGSIKVKADALKLTASGVEMVLANGWVQFFNGGYGIWAQKGGAEAYAVYGSIFNVYTGLGRENSLLGYPVSDEKASPGGAGRISYFERGVITGNGAWFPVIGALYERYKELGLDAGHLGFPRGAEVRLSGGWAQEFDGGNLYYKDGADKAYPVYGVLLKTWGSAGYQDSNLGWPVEDEVVAPNGWTQRFDRATVFVKNDGLNRGFFLLNAILDKYRALGGPDGLLGWPTSNETADGTGGSYANFDNGAISWHKTTGAYATYGPVRAAWAAGFYETNEYTGYPASDPIHAEDGSWSQKFQHTTITVKPDGTAVFDLTGSFK